MPQNDNAHSIRMVSSLEKMQEKMQREEWKKNTRYP